MVKDGHWGYRLLVIEDLHSGERQDTRESGTPDPGPRTPLLSFPRSLIDVVVPGNAGEPDRSPIGA
jgi:hypothetical protein